MSGNWLRRGQLDFDTAAVGVVKGETGVDWTLVGNICEFT
jgi:hypothetical protein